MNTAVSSTKEKARLLDEYMRTGDLAALVKGYTDLNATATAKSEPKSPETPVRDPHKENTGYTYFDVTF